MKLSPPPPAGECTPPRLPSHLPNVRALWHGGRDRPAGAVCGSCLCSVTWLGKRGLEMRRLCRKCFVASRLLLEGSQYGPRRGGGAGLQLSRFGCGNPSGPPGFLSRLRRCKKKLGTWGEHLGNEIAKLKGPALPTSSRNPAPWLEGGLDGLLRVEGMRDVLGEQVDALTGRRHTRYAVQAAPAPSPASATCSGRGFFPSPTLPAVQPCLGKANTSPETLRREFVQERMNALCVY